MIIINENEARHTVPEMMELFVLFRLVLCVVSERVIIVTHALFIALIKENVFCLFSHFLRSF